MQITSMNSPAILQLMTLLSPAFPVGGFAYSAGLETTCQTGMVKTREELRDWIETSMQYGALRTDAILLAQCHNQAVPCAEINALALALCGSKERYEETTSMAAAFIDAARPWMNRTFQDLPTACAYCVAVGQVSRQMGLDVEQVLLAYLQAAISNQLQAALRLMALGQKAASELQHSLEPSIVDCTKMAVASSLDDLGSCSVAMEIAALNHETLVSRIFRS